MDDRSRPGELDYIEDMLEAAEKIERYTDAMSQGSSFLMRKLWMQFFAT